MNRTYAPQSTGLSFVTWTTDTSDDGHWTKIVDSESNSGQSTDGAWKFYLESTG